MSAQFRRPPDVCIVDSSDDPSVVPEEENELKDRAVLVTGANRGIGQALVAEAYGAAQARYTPVRAVPDPQRCAPSRP